MSIPQNSLVLYKNAPARVTVLGDKLEIELEDRRTLRVRPKDVLLLHPGPLPSLQGWGEVPNPEVEAACELLDGSETCLAELADLLYGAYTPATAWATWRLVDEGLYFHGTTEAIWARPLTEVAQERAAREAKTAEREAWNGFLRRARAGHCNAEDARYLAEVESLIWGERENSRVLQALECQQNAESAHALLLRIGYWNEQHDPCPRRAGVILEPPTAHLGHLPEEPRLDLTGLPAFAIDDYGNLDPDDALSLDGDRLWIHIADVAALVPPGSPADVDACGRGATLYLPDQTITMLPAQAVQHLGLG